MAGSATLTRVVSRLTRNAARRSAIRIAGFDRWERIVEILRLLLEKVNQINLNLKLVDKDGQRLFCRSDYETGSHIQRDTTCFTAEQLDKLQERTQRDWDQLTSRGALGAGGIRGP